VQCEVKYLVDIFLIESSGGKLIECVVRHEIDAGVWCPDPETNFDSRLLLSINNNHEIAKLIYMFA
jgi:hypothetical protein